MHNNMPISLVNFKARIYSHRFESKLGIIIRDTSLAPEASPISIISIHPRHHVSVEGNISMTLMLAVIKYVDKPEYAFEFVTEQVLSIQYYDEVTQ